MQLIKDSHLSEDHQEDIPDKLAIKAPTKDEMRILWVLLFGGVLSVGIFIYWFFTDTLPGFYPLFILLVISISFKILKLLHEWYHYAAISVPEPPEVTRQWTVDMLTTFCAGEPYEMVIGTLKAMKAVRYPHTTYLCDEADDPYLKQVCEELDVVYVYRGPKKENAKAGNINYALENFAKGEIAIILDPDHKPRPDFIEKAIPYFENEKVGFVQCVQAYGNQNDSLIAKGAAEHTYHFYGPMMMSMNSYGTVQAIGANCTFRRAALDSIGGHAPGLSEDMHTAMRLHSRGWESVYVPENLSRGLVPTTLGAFYKQQLKWSRGSFDLLFFKFPKLVKGYSWRQIIHYLTIPLYFLSGLIAAIDIFLPMIALIMGRSPLYVNLWDMAQVTLPMFFFLYVNRLYVQRWTLERQEKGLHFWGGVLMLNTWWVYLTGFIYTLFNVKVPYIPTPKDDEVADEWRICIPNLVVMGLGLVAIAYGLSVDWSPYSFFMSGLVLTNFFFLGIGVLTAQRKTISKFYYVLVHGSLSKPRMMWSSFRHDVIYRGFRSKKVAATLSTVIIGAILASFVIPFKPVVRLADLEEDKVIHTYEGMQWGVASEAVNVADTDIQNNIHFASVILAWDTTQQDAGATFWQVFESGLTPFVLWQAPQGDSLQGVYKKIADGLYDPYLLRMGYDLNDYREIIYATCLPAPDVEVSIEILNLYAAAFDHILTLYAEKNLSNIKWILPEQLAVSEVLDSANMDLLYGWSVNGADATEVMADVEKGQSTHPSLEDMPLFITGIKPENLDETTSWDWLTEVDVKGMALALDQPGEFAGWVTALMDFAQDNDLKVAPVRALPILSGESLVQNVGGNIHLVRDDEKEQQSRTLIQRMGEGQFQMLVDGEPFYIKGVAYNPGHDWRDGYAPLVKERLDEDFVAIKEMGGNTIRRYSPSIYDHNILEAAQEHDLKVLYGFWFDPKVDYYAELDEIEDYRREVISKVKKYRDHPAILAWSIGNESWGIIKQYNEEDHTPRVRRAYLTMLEELAQEIHALDPTRPVFSMEEHSEFLDRAVQAFNRYAPSIDVIGVNSYYQPRISQLHSTMEQHSPARPYLVSEFGPKGYWDPELSTLGNFGRAWEESDLEKAQGYYDQWHHYVEAYDNQNLGGVAFCWRDRMEGSLTWFGLTDFSNQKKLGYYALKQAWTGQPTLDAWPDVRLIVNAFSETLYEARVVLPQETRRSYEFKWTLVRDEYLDEVGSGDLEGHNAYYCYFELPKPADSTTLYRIYLHMSDDEGNVITASYPINPLK